MFELVPNQELYWEKIRELRTHPDNVEGFLCVNLITADQQRKYMEKHSKNYFVCLLCGEPVGYVGVIDGDIRICTHPDHKGKGVGKFMLGEVVSIFPNASGKIKKQNVASQKLFDKCKVPYTLI